MQLSFDSKGKCCSFVRCRPLAKRKEGGWMDVIDEWLYDEAEEGERYREE